MLLFLMYVIDDGVLFIIRLVIKLTMSTGKLPLLG